MNLYRLKAQKEGRSVYQCVVSSDDIMISTNYWLEQGCDVLITKF